jgi:hypothetical protein
VVIGTVAGGVEPVRYADGHGIDLRELKHVGTTFGSSQY